PEYPDVNVGFAKPETQALCEAARNAVPPASDWPSAAEAAGLKSCLSESLYEGIGMKKDPVRARKCALLEMATHRTTGPEFSGPHILMMIYANGEGVRRDYDIATHWACALTESALDIETLTA